jgi:hypothetical protein
MDEPVVEVEFVQIFRRRDDRRNLQNGRLDIGQWLPLPGLADPVQHTFRIAYCFRPEELKEIARTYVPVNLSLSPIAGPRLNVS